MNPVDKIMLLSNLVGGTQSVVAALPALSFYSMYAKLKPTFRQTTLNLTKNSTTMSGPVTPKRSSSRGRSRSRSKPATRKRSISRGRSRSRKRVRGRSTGSNRGPVYSTPSPGRGNNDISGNDQPQGINTQMFAVNIASKAKHKTGGATWNYRINYHGITTSAVGQQAMTDLFFVNSLQQLFTSSGNGYSTDQSYTALNLLNPYQKQTGSTLWATPTFANDVFVIKYVNVFFDVTNFGDSAVLFDLHLFKSATYQNDVPRTVVTNGLLQQGNNVAAIAAPTLAATDTQGSIAITYPGVHPSEARALSKSWKIQGTKSVNLAAGATENLCFKIAMNYKVRQDALVELGASYNPHTMCFSIVQRGQLAKDTINLDATYANTSLGWVANVQYVMTGVMDNANRINTGYAAGQVTNNTIQQIGQTFAKAAPVIL